MFTHAGVLVEAELLLLAAAALLLSAMPQPMCDALCIALTVHLPPYFSPAVAGR